MNTKIITHGEPGKLLGNTRNCPYQVPKLFSDMEDADYYIQAAKRLQKIQIKNYSYSVVLMCCLLAKYTVKNKPFLGKWPMGRSSHFCQ
ncbi:unnamed protein product [Acanthoscelides obtectus]|uniref:Uncharacterized protein n=1 Tax=Acanthoscelides obtectus TaxID=200917 RepID=A0A9P0JMI5_ACAOB|nr:unnamed protein product [Acanthoscelides obtectus]CAK1642772.1 hypothetical protein AOBTE_LOCUS13205 [Acanthoscelides obtectus]